MKTFILRGEISSARVNISPLRTEVSPLRTEVSPLRVALMISSREVLGGESVLFFWCVSFTPWLQPGGKLTVSLDEPFERFPLIAGRKPLKRLINSSQCSGTGLKPRCEGESNRPLMKV